MIGHFCSSTPSVAVLVITVVNRIFCFIFEPENPKSYRNEPHNWGQSRLYVISQFTYQKTPL